MARAASCRERGVADSLMAEVGEHEASILSTSKWGLSFSLTAEESSFRPLGIEWTFAIKEKSSSLIRRTQIK